MIRQEIKYYLIIFCTLACLQFNKQMFAAEQTQLNLPGFGQVSLVIEEFSVISVDQGNGTDLRHKLMSYFDKHLPESLAKWLNRIIQATYLSTLTFVLACLVSYFFLSVIFVILFILVNNIWRAIKERKYRKLREFYQANLIDTVFNRDLGAFAKLTCQRSPKKRAVLINEIMKMQKDVSGEAYQSLREIYIALDLDKVSIKKLTEPRWPKKIEGLREVSEMDVKSALPMINKYPDSRHDILRSEAQLAIVRLNDKDTFSFLDGFEGHLTRWEQLQIYNIVNRYGITVPDFSKWFGSQNDSVVIFAVKMTVLLNQGYVERQLLKLLNHSNPRVREATILAIGSLELTDHDTRLIEQYPEELDINKIAILKALQMIPDENQIGFLARVTDEGNFDRQFEAVKALYQIGELGKIRLIKIEKERDENFKHIVKHIYDNRI